MKTLKAMLCMLMAALLLAGCAATTPEDTKPDTTTIPDTTLAQTEATVETTVATELFAPVYPERSVTALPEKAPVEDVVSSYWEETLEWVDKPGNVCRLPIAIPQIYPFSEDAIRCEKEIFDVLFPIAEETLANMEEELSQSWARIGYEAFVNGDVLSLLIVKETVYDLTEYHVYNLDLSTGKQLTREGLLEKLAVSEADFKAAAETAVEKTFVNRYGEKEKSYDQDFYQEQLDRSLSKENLEKTEIYLDAEGKAVLVADIYAMAGATSYPTRISLNFE